MNFAKFRARKPLDIRLPDGARKADIREVQSTLMPPATKTFTPISHGEFVETVIEKIFDRGLTIRETFHSLSHAGLRYFGMLDVRSKNYSPDHSWIVALVNANDKTDSARMVVGCRLFGSGALAFSGEVEMSRRHTKSIVKDLPELADRAIEELWSQWSLLDSRLECYKSCPITEKDMAFIVVSAFEKGIISTRELPRILKLYRKPKDDLFRSRTAWSLFNSILIAMHDLNASSVIRDTMQIVALFDDLCEFKCVPSNHIQPNLI